MGGSSARRTRCSSSRHSRSCSRAGEPGRYHLTWVGRGPLESDVLALAGRLGVLERITFHGYVAFGEELFDLYRKADMFVHVSLTEGVPQVIVEALACGTPVVATAVGGVEAAFGTPGAALLIPPADKRALVAAIGTSRLRGCVT